MIDPLVSLSFAIQSNKGVYALLLGSGVSRAAGIPTGWEVVLDLARRLAEASGEQTGGDAAAWYKTKFGKEPDYAELLDALSKTPAERQQLLKAYFEPDDEERKQGLKQPTKAHKAIAKLVAQGFIRVIVTTNFDRLIERAIEEEGITPVVISTADATEGALPIAHQQCCVIKVHGDYHDTRIKNTADELARYDARLDALLNQVFDSFGLVVCGWSAQWDTALRAALERSPSRRFSLYWAAKNAPASEATKLIGLRAGSVVTITDADAFFVKVQSMVEGLERSRRPHPASVEAIAALTKRLLSSSEWAIELSDLVHDESERARQGIDAVSIEVLKTKSTKNLVTDFEHYRSAIGRVQAILVQGGAWGRPEHESLWVEAIERSAIAAKAGGEVLTTWLRLYPTMVLLFSIGLAAVAREQLATVRAVLYRPLFREFNETKPIVLNEFWGNMHDPIKQIPAYANTYTPRSEHLVEVLREPLRRYIPDDDKYADVFDRFEYLVAMTFLDLDDKDNKGYGKPWAPPGRFCWKARRSSDNVVAEAERQLKDEGANWAPLRAGFFGGQKDRAATLQASLREFVNRVPFY